MVRLVQQLSQLRHLSAESAHLCQVVYSTNMPKERGKEWEHLKVVSKKGQSFQVQCNYCDKQFWIGSGQRIRAHLGVQTLCGVNKCEKVYFTAIKFIKRLSACTFV